MSTNDNNDNISVEPTIDFDKNCDNKENEEMFKDEDNAALIQSMLDFEESTLANSINDKLPNIQRNNNTEVKNENTDKILIKKIKKPADNTNDELLPPPPPPL